MQVYRSLEQVERSKSAGGALSIGNFDGVHLGHRQLIERAGQVARPAVAMTFEPQPLAVLSPRQAPPVITPLELKLDLLAEAGADVAVVLPTGRELLALEPEQFVRTIVVERFSPQAVVEGPDFGFGRGRSGDIETLRALGGRFGFAVHVVEGVARRLPGHQEPTVISSTLIRRLIGGGAVEAAAVCLGRAYRLLGRPVSGQGRGRQLGFPTVNLDTGEQLLPAEGVYAGLCHWPDHTSAAAINIGPAPTFGEFQPAVEAHLIDYDGAAAPGAVALDVVARVRGIEKFESPGDLAAQITRDVEEARRLTATYLKTDS